MKAHYPKVRITALCKLFGKSRQAYYDTDSRIDQQGLKQHIILDEVLNIRNVLPKTGMLKLYHMLQPLFKASGIHLGRDRFFLLLKQHGLQLKQRKYSTRTTQSNHHFHKWDNLITELSLSQPGQLWVSDITYLRTQTGFVYLSLITDACSKKIVGYHVSQHLKTKSSIIALQKAIRQETERSSAIIHHSDRGVQYCCDAYIKLLQAHNIKISMTQSSSPYDNAIAERVNGILKTELGLKQTFEGYKHAVQCVNEAIYKYNNLRLHMSCNFQTPIKKHQSTL
jgi:putative transposase